MQAAMFGFGATLGADAANAAVGDVKVGPTVSWTAKDVIGVYADNELCRNGGVTEWGCAGLADAQSRWIESIIEHFPAEHEEHGWCYEITMVQMHSSMAAASS